MHRTQLKFLLRNVRSSWKSWPREKKKREREKEKKFYSPFIYFPRYRSSSLEVKFLPLLLERTLKSIKSEMVQMYPFPGERMKDRWKRMEHQLGVQNKGIPPPPVFRFVFTSRANQRRVSLHPPPVDVCHNILILNRVTDQPCVRIIRRYSVAVYIRAYCKSTRRRGTWAACEQRTPNRGKRKREREREEE